MASKEIKQTSLRRARNSLNRDLILDAAHSLGQSGVEISLRNVAEKLDCSAMALYRHFPDKQELLLGLLDRVIGSIQIRNDSLPWDERLLKLSKDHLRVLQGNPWAIPLLFLNPDPGPAVRNVGEAMLSALKEGGINGDSAVRTFSSILALNYGWAGFTAIKPHNANSTRLAQNLRQGPTSGDGLPITSELWGQFEHLGSDEHHDVALRKLISTSL